MELRNEPNVRQELGLAKIVIVSAIISAILGTIFFFAGNFLPSSKTFADGGGTVFTSKKTGNWTATSTWTETGSGIPVKYIILSGHTVTVNSSRDDIDTIKVYGTLKFNNGKDLTLDGNAGVVEVMSGGVITGGNTSSEIIFDDEYEIAGPFSIAGPVHATGESDGFSAGPLPVTWLSFDSEVEENFVTLNWKTASEENNSHFIIEKAPSTGAFKAIGRVEGNGNSQEIQTYAYKDKESISSSTYYRLKQFDFDGKFNYSKTIFVKSDKEEMAEKVLFPSLVNFGQTSQLNISNVPAGQYQIMVIDVKGNIITQFDHTQMELGMLEITNLATEGFARGMHYIRLNTQSTAETFKLMIK
jgi:hypothetical protein